MSALGQKRTPATLCDGIHQRTLYPTGGDPAALPIDQLTMSAAIQTTAAQCVRLIGLVCSSGSPPSVTEVFPARNKETIGPPFGGIYPAHPGSRGYRQRRTVVSAKIGLLS